MSSTDSGDTITLNIKAPNEKKYSVTVGKEQSILELKEAVAVESEIPAGEQRLIYGGRVLKDNDQIASHDMKEGHTIHLVRAMGARPPPSAAPAPPPQTSPYSSAMPTNFPPQSTPGNFPSFSYGNMGQSPFMGGAPDRAAAESLMSNPEALNSMMQTPEFQMALQQMAQNPQLVQQLVASSPEFQSMPPEMQQMMADPNMIRMMFDPQMIQMAQRFRTVGGTQGATPTQFSSLPYSMPSFPPANVPTTPQEPPEIRFQSQLQQLVDMGFYETETNIRALLLSGGNVNIAVERLVSGEIPNFPISRNNAQQQQPPQNRQDPPPGYS